MDSDRVEMIKRNIYDLLKIVKKLEDNFPGRKFTLDGHLLGSIGEVLAEYYYDITLYPNSNPKHDGVDKNQREVQIKISQNYSVDINEKPDYLLVLFLKKSEGKVYEVYNGPGNIVIEKDAKPTKSGWYSRSFSKLTKLDKTVEEKDRIRQINTIDKWNNSIRN